jgi:hypothetical protein
MTRDDAVAIVGKRSGGRSILVFDAGGFVELLVQLKILDLDEPKSADRKLQDAIQILDFHPSIYSDINEVLQKAGLKLVEK